LVAYDGRHFQIQNVPIGSKVSPGDRVFTSGLGQSVPRGIEMGTVSSVELATAELFLAVEMQPAVDFGSLDRVFLVTRPGPWYFRPGDVPGEPADSTSQASPEVSDS
jgi:rod shape-determining protein MreC